MDLQRNYQSFEALNAEVIAVAVHDTTRAQNVAAVVGASFPVLADPEHSTTDAYNVYNLLGDGLATPSVFIIDINGNIDWSYVGQNPSDRPTAENILDHLPGDSQTLE